MFEGLRLGLGFGSDRERHIHCRLSVVELHMGNKGGLYQEIESDAFQSEIGYLRRRIDSYFGPLRSHFEDRLSELAE